MSANTVETQSAKRPVEYRENRLRDLWDNGGMLILFILIFADCWLFIPYFNTRNNMLGLSVSITTVGIVACTMLFCLASGDFDLSVGSVLAMSSVVSALVVNQTHSIFLGITAAMIAGGIAGLVNGVVIARLGINALIATLATMQIVRGLGFLLGRTQSISIHYDPFFRMGNAMLLGIPMPVWAMIACFIFFGLLLHKTVFGRNTLAIGGNREAAQLAGVAVVRTKVIIFAMQGAIAGLAGAIVAAQASLGDPKEGQGLELNVIAACVLGGVSLTGGTGTIMAVIVGALIMGTVKNAMNLENINPFYQYLVSGSILLSAVLLDRLKNRGKS
jgi:L-arabinose transport system permease protein